MLSVVCKCPGFANRVLGPTKTTFISLRRVSRRHKSLSRLHVNENEIDPVQERSRGSPSRYIGWGVTMAALLAGGVGFYGLKQWKSRLEVAKIADSNRSAEGSGRIGGPFKLLSSLGKTFTEKDLLGSFTLVYFGFSHCPDVCPEELDKLSAWLHKLQEKHNLKMLSLFISCDPARDTPEVLEEYLKDFHPSIIGLTGSYDAIRDICSKYKAYFSTPENADPNSDYIVDHSAYFYLMDPEGNFIDILGRDLDEDTGVERILEHVNAYVPKEERERRKSKWYSFLYKY